jgi:capsular exopolysaccharide synthesis family protein
MPMITEPIQNSQFNHNADEDDTSDFRHYVYLLWHWAWLILVITLLAGAGGYIASEHMTPVYQTSTKLLVIQAGSNSSLNYEGVLASQSLTGTYSNMMATTSILQDVVKKLGITVNLVTLAKQISVTPVRDTQLIVVSVKGTDPVQISLIANTLVLTFVDKINTIQAKRFPNSQENLQTQLTSVQKQLQDANDQKNATNDLAEKKRLDSLIVQYQQIYTSLLTNYEQARLAEVQINNSIVQINQAEPPTIPIQPNVKIYTALSAIITAILTMAILFIIDTFDDTIKTPLQVSRILNLPVLGIIPRHKKDVSLISQVAPSSPVSEAFRSLRANLLGTITDEPLHSILVTSPSPKEGKSLVSSNFSVVLAQAGNKVILVDADLRHPTIHVMLKIPNITGLTTLLLKRSSSLDSVIQPTDTTDLFAITTGEGSPVLASMELFGSKNMGMIIEKLKESSAIVVVDSPPILPVADTKIIAPLIDGVLLVVQPGKTTFAEMREAMKQLKLVRANIFGVILNNVNLNNPPYRYLYPKNYKYYKEKKLKLEKSSIEKY